MNAKKGLLLALITAIFWGTLPIAAKQTLSVMDAQTLVAYRFATAFLFLTFILLKKRKIPPLLLIFRHRYLILIGSICLAGNFYLFSQTLHYLNPEAAQMLGQLSPFALLLASIIFLKEPILKHQYYAAMLLLIGMALFFNQSWQHISHGQLFGMFLSISASSIWACYAIAQKRLNSHISAQGILWIFYCLSTLLLLPLAKPMQIADLDPFLWICFIFCCLNTPIAYGAFAEAIACWQVNKVSATITTVPLFTIVFLELLSLILPERFSAPNLNLIAYLGAGIIIGAALFSVLFGKKE